jgi:hypothetical protein
VYSILLLNNFPYGVTHSLIGNNNQLSCYSFNYSELTENMRQREDLEYAHMMQRCRIGSPSDEDVRQLLTRMITHLKKPTG